MCVCVVLHLSYLSLHTYTSSPSIIYSKQLLAGIRRHNMKAFFPWNSYEFVKVQPQKEFQPCDQLAGGNPGGNHSKVQNPATTDTVLAN